MNCRGACGRPLLIGGVTGPRHRRRRLPAPEGFAWHEARERCLPCYRLLMRPRTASRWHRGTHLIEDTAELAGQGLTGAQIALRLGISWDGLRQAHRRAGVAVPVPKNPDTEKYVSRTTREDVSRGTSTVRPRRAA